ncbi:MAG: hypothetical protein A4E49_02498 [Methanosaeta sp. PtaU1.Bin112]|nr:MAG: hypothetical protein A4E49_02498 [Methanosaeta sp. PtaU1.Bin112]
MSRITSKSWLIIMAVALIAAVVFFYGDRGPSSSKSPVSGFGYSGAGIPENYYFSMNAADIDSPIELVRFATSIKPDTSSLDIPMRAAYYQWYLKNRGFNASFAYSDNFRNQGIEHVWLLVKNQQGESMYVDPSSDRMKADSICPTTPEYKRYQETYKDINELSRSTGGVEKYAWWNTNDGKKLYENSVLLLKKEQL